jgi:hypothetical protein
MDYLSMLRVAESENTPPHPTAITALSPYGSKGSARGERISANDDEDVAANDSGIDAGMEARRQRVLAILEAHPSLTYAVVTDSAAEPGVVVMHIAIRGVGSGELVIAQSRYDGAELLRALERAGCGEALGDQRETH